MKRVNKIIIAILIFVVIFNTKIFAHSGNITGWKKKDSKEIKEYNGEFYGYHEQNKVKHYHQIKWDEEKQKWEIIKTAVYYDENFNIINEIDNSKQEKIEVKYNKNIDGDTAKFKLNNEIITVRFLGVDTPETKHPTKGEEAFGKEASNYTKEKLENATKIEIEYDEKASKLDKYERHLVWIWVDDSLIQKELIEKGLAKVYMLQDDYKYAWILQEEQEKAQKDEIGIWSEEENKQENVVTSEENWNINDDIIEIISLVFFIILIILLKK